MRTFLTLLTITVLSGCTGMPQGVTPVSNFELERYLGTWFEITRLDHSFERGLEQVTATYSLRKDGGVRVINRGYSTRNNEWQQAEGKAWFVQDANTGHLKVSFFGPFYGAYIVFGLDKTNYQYAFVSGPSKSYLWLLARQPKVPQSVIEQFKAQSMALGFDTEKLIFVEH